MSDPRIYHCMFWFSDSLCLNSPPHLAVHSLRPGDKDTEKKPQDKLLRHWLFLILHFHWLFFLFQHLEGSSKISKTTLHKTKTILKITTHCVAMMSPQLIPNDHQCESTLTHKVSISPIFVDTASLLFSVKIFHRSTQALLCCQEFSQWFCDFFFFLILSRNWEWSSFIYSLFLQQIFAAIFFIKKKKKLDIFFSSKPQLVFFYPPHGSALTTFFHTVAWTLATSCYCNAWWRTLVFCPRVCHTVFNCGNICTAAH